MDMASAKGTFFECKESSAKHHDSSTISTTSIVLFKSVFSLVVIMQPSVLQDGHGQTYLPV